MIGAWVDGDLNLRSNRLGAIGEDMATIYWKYEELTTVRTAVSVFEERFA